MGCRCWRTRCARSTAQSVDEIVIAAREEDLLTYAELCKTYGIRKAGQGGRGRRDKTGIRAARAALEARADAKLLLSRTERVRS